MQVLNNDLNKLVKVKKRSQKLIKLKLVEFARKIEEMDSKRGFNHCKI